jgi:hypothetical protein
MDSYTALWFKDKRINSNGNKLESPEERAVCVDSSWLSCATFVSFGVEQETCYVRLYRDRGRKMVRLTFFWGFLDFPQFKIDNVSRYLPYFGVS